MRAILLSPTAINDLRSIWSYGEERWGPDQAESYIRGIQRSVETLAAHPQRGRSCDDVRPGYFKYAAGQHLIFFRLSREAIDVVRILHQRMDHRRHL